MVIEKRAWSEEEIDLLRYRCRQARLRLELHQQDLAEKLGWSVNTVGNFERGTNTPSPANLGRLADVVDRLLSDAEKRDASLTGDSESGEPNKGGHDCDEQVERGTGTMGRMFVERVDGSTAWRLLDQAYRKGDKEDADAIASLLDRREDAERTLKDLNDKLLEIAKRFGFTTGLMFSTNVMAAVIGTLLILS